MCTHSSFTWEAKIYLGTTIGYGSETVPLDTIRQKIQEICDKVGLGLTFTKTEFIYTGGSEIGCIIGLINYPRFPKFTSELEAIAMDVAMQLKELAQQERVSIVFPDKTVMLGEK